jgi:hypothetical protein
MYQWSHGTAICVAVFGHKKQNDVILNPERNARIGNCQSLFVICNNLEVTLAMLRTDSLLSVIRRLRSIRSSNVGGDGEGRSPGHFFSAESVKNLEADPDDDDSEAAGDSAGVEMVKKPPSFRTRAYTETVQRSIPEADITPLVFTRAQSSYRKSVTSAPPAPKSIHEALMDEV